MINEMTEHGAALQTYNQELVKCIEDLKSKRNELAEIINREEAERVVLEKNLKSLQDKLRLLNQNLEHHKQICENYEKTIQETEIGFKKILESSQALLNMAQHEANKLDHISHTSSEHFISIKNVLQQCPNITELDY